MNTSPNESPIEAHQQGSALQKGLEEKSREFSEKGNEIYAKA